MSFGNRLRNHFLNIRGKRIDRKVIVIESDDWGSIRMPSKEVYDYLSRSGYMPALDPYLRFDALASVTDLECLFETLRSIKGGAGGGPIITANSIIANPDFKRIQENGFKSYFYEPFTETLKRYPFCQDSFSLWKQGMADKLFWPQFHGREHVNVFQWMKALKAGDEMVHKAFQVRMLSISSVKSHMRFGYMESLDYLSAEERLEKAEIVRQGLQLFKQIFGYASDSFIACCYIWDDLVERELANNGVTILQGISNQIVPTLESGLPHKYRRHFFGEQNSFRQRYLVRNAFFEPSLDPRIDWVGECLVRIKIAFDWGKPAIIGSHRLNYIGSIEQGNRDKNLVLLKRLLSAAVKEWPDVEFMSTNQLKEFFKEER